MVVTPGCGHRYAVFSPYVGCTTVYTTFATLYVWSSSWLTALPFHLNMCKGYSDWHQSTKSGLFDSIIIIIVHRKGLRVFSTDRLNGNVAQSCDYVVRVFLAFSTIGL